MTGYNFNTAEPEEDENPFIDLDDEEYERCDDEESDDEEYYDEEYDDEDSDDEEPDGESGQDSIYNKAWISFINFLNYCKNIR